MTNSFQVMMDALGVTDVLDLANQNGTVYHSLLSSDVLIETTDLSEDEKTANRKRAKEVS